MYCIVVITARDYPLINLAKPNLHLFICSYRREFKFTVGESRYRMRAVRSQLKKVTMLTQYSIV